MPTHQILASDDDWAALAALAEPEAGDRDASDEDDDSDDLLEELLKPSDEVVRVSRRIAGQYVEVIARFAAGAFGREGERSRVPTDQVGTAARALLRLADASGDHAQHALLEELLALSGPATQGRRNSRSRQRALTSLRDWIPRFAATLEPDDGARLLRLIAWQRGEAPLLEELRGVHGIGPRRLQRLYAAGLFTIDAVSGADPADIAAVTSIPLPLAEDVVRATRAFAREERRRCVDALQHGARRLRSILRASPGGDDALAAAAERALSEVERALRGLDADHPEEGT